MKNYLNSKFKLYLKEDVLISYILKCEFLNKRVFILAELGFEPLTSQLGISGTSYRVQLGLINEKWASRIVKGKDVLDSKVYRDEDITDGGFPNQNYIVAWCLQTLVLPNINPHQIMKTVNALVKQAMTNKDKKKVRATVQEAKDVELTKVAEEDLRRPKAKGWVKEEDAKTPEQLESEKRAAFQERMKAKQAQGEVKTIKTTRQLPSIPIGGGEGRAQAPVQAPTKDISKFCPYCGKDIEPKICPFCGKPLPHPH